MLTILKPDSYTSHVMAYEYHWYLVHEGVGSSLLFIKRTASGQPVLSYKEYCSINNHLP
jgi:hypothetical protein